MPKNPNAAAAKWWAMMPDVLARRSFTAIVIAVAAFASVGELAAQSYPVRPITMIVPFPAGGATDTLARYLAEQMRPALGQSIIIENVGGAAGSIGVGRAVRSTPDGYTLSIGTSTTHMLTGGLYALSFDLLKDLEPVIYIGSEPLLIAARKNFPADDLKGLIGYLKANPDKVSVGIAGVGAAGHLAGIAFQNKTGTKFQFVPYRGNAPAMQDLLAGQIDFMMEPSSNFRGLIATDSIKPIAVTGTTRLPASPNIPTVEQAGLPGFTASLWYGLWAPKGTPKEIIEKLNATLRDVLADPSVQKRFDDFGTQIAPRDQQFPEALRAFQKAETERWWPIIKASNLKAE
jgi:tripartite-type tricarboxylate transporter receptor subunit TctC